MCSNVFKLKICVIRVVPRYQKIEVVTNYEVCHTHGKMPSVERADVAFFDITFVACAASPIESPARGGMFVAPVPLCGAGVKGQNYPSISASVSACRT
jgi:hypothetical protein